ncbi:MAG: RCC1 domain-containing protein, partial [Chloroflexota bacterium]|nr:RCC1 domain-containing protein [Chloroflexota bacterium]
MTSGVSAVFSGGDHACALLATGVLKCWGGNTSGQLGDGTLVNT